ncbi:MAG TPA: hypothetical protein VMV72_19400 [Verrucomicrobiae bacterium]|nr:hypothetical protein [Verrucomicrobiae bacterium]
MNVTLIPLRRQAISGPRIASRIIRAARLVACIGLTGGLLAARAETVTNLEAVDSNGVSTWNGTFPFTVTGVLLTDPGEMLDSTPDFIPWNNGAGVYQLGGQWQVFVQALSPDRGGIECWMAQNYGNLPWEPHDGSDSYSNDAWAAEVQRVSYDPSTGCALHKGDLVTVTANGALFYGGMFNINEEHDTDPAYNFTISLVTSNYGLPAAEVISLSSVIGTNVSAMGHYDIFDPTRATGGEHWQGMRVRINALTLVTTNGWTTNSDWSSRFCTVTDGEGRQFPLVHPLYDIGPPPTNTFDATGVFLQESGSATDGMFGYELFVQEVSPSDTAAVNIARQGSAVVLSWPASLGNWQLQCSDSLSAPNWTAVTNSPTTANGQSTVVWPITTPQKFFRLLRVQ